MHADPPRDGNGKILPHDHPEILETHHVIRHTTPNDLTLDLQTGKQRIASGAFSESSGGGMSVDIEEWMAADGLPPLFYVAETTHGAVRLNVGALRQLGFQVGWDPDDAHPHHGAVWGIGNGSKRKKKILVIAVTMKKR